MLFTLKTPPGDENDLMRGITITTRKQLRTEPCDGKNCERITKRFVLKGCRVCLQAFAAVTQLSTEKILLYALEVGATTEAEIYHTGKRTNRVGKYSVQRVVVRAFLIKVANDLGMECPRRRGSKDESPIRILPSIFT